MRDGYSGEPRTPQQPGEAGVKVLAGVEAEQLAPARTIVHGEAGTGHPWPGEGVVGEGGLGSFAEQVNIVVVHWTID